MKLEIEELAAIFCGLTFSIPAAAAVAAFAKFMAEEDILPFKRRKGGRGIRVGEGGARRPPHVKDGDLPSLLSPPPPPPPPMTYVFTLEVCSQ